MASQQYAGAVHECASSAAALKSESLQRALEANVALIKANEEAMANGLPKVVKEY